MDAYWSARRPVARRGGWQTAAAQAARSFAAVAGVGSSTFTGADITGANQVGFLVGGLADLPVTERISVRPGLVFNQKGAKDDPAAAGATIA